ncbi:hypothetical protein H072_3359 [Dactylellina haptotyla CBS 200.50]|uniref:Uncharacterized protein n=1 Tax=Dactylellina haptotyla (strain CBS 200.50) TaxID=1284197 RepID=S8AI07_DACHA|nr:hypothetical protein H072_3359 [Dactylellina haptotyla CBS 200.50]
MPPQPPPDKTTLVIPSSPPLPPANPLPLTGQKRFLDIDPSSDDIPVFSSDDLPPKEVFANPYDAYRRTARTVKRPRSETIQSAYMKRRIEQAYLSSDQLDDDGLPNSSAKSKAAQDTLWSDEDDDANTSMSTIVPPRSDDILDSQQDILLSASIEDPQDTKANLIIQKAIEEGSTDIYLDGLSLERIPSDISSLSSLIHQPKDDLSTAKSVPAKAIPKPSSGLFRSSSGINPTVSTPYTSMLAKIYLHLVHNSISHLPPSLTNLKNVTGLYLRKNDLRSLPSHISSMTSLTQLSLGENQLAYFPFSILSLPNLEYRSFNAFPNPLLTCGMGGLVLPPSILHTEWFSTIKYTTTRAAHNVPPGKGGFIPSAANATTVFNFISSTPISVFNDIGRLVTPPLTDELPHPSAWITSPPLTTLPPPLPLLTSPQKSPKRDHISRFPSLQELCLRRMATDVMYTSLSKAQREEIYQTIPEHLQRQVEDVLEFPGEAMKRCPACQGGYVSKGAEWIEFWHCQGQNEPDVAVVPADGAAEENVEGKDDWEVCYVKPRGVDAFLEKFVAGYEDPACRDDGMTKFYEGIAGAQRLYEVAEELRGLEGDGVGFLKKYVAGVKGRVLPLLRDVCSWECAEEWMEGRMAAERELMGME